MEYMHQMRKSIKLKKKDKPNSISKVLKSATEDTVKHEKP